MPNWIMNQLVAYNLDPTAKTALEQAFKSDRPFQAICPMPKILEDTQSPVPYCLEKMFGRALRPLSLLIDESKLYTSSVRKNGWRQKILEIGVDEVMRRIDEDKTIEADIAEKAKLAITAIVETEYANWYDWRLDKWGVKWDASNVSVEDETSFQDEPTKNPDLIVDFYTPWGPPSGVLQEITEQYPEARFYLRWADEFGPGNGIGFLVAEAGLIDERDIDDEKDFFDNLWFGRDS